MRYHTTVLPPICQHFAVTEVKTARGSRASRGVVWCLQHLTRKPLQCEKSKRRRSRCAAPNLANVGAAFVISFLESPEIVKDEYRWPAALRARALNTPCATPAIAYACTSATISIHKFRGVLISLPGAAAYRVTELHGRIPAVPIRNVARVSSTRATGW